MKIRIALVVCIVALLSLTVSAQLNISGNPPLPVAYGGTARTSLTADCPLVGAGASAPSATCLLYLTATRNQLPTASVFGWASGATGGSANDLSLGRIDSTHLGIGNAAGSYSGTAYIGDSSNPVLGVYQSTFLSGSNCADSAGAAACGSAAAGAFVIDAGSTSTVVSTTAVTANSEIHVTEDSSLNTRLGITCNTQSILVVGSPVVTARTAATSFTVSVVVAPTATPTCYNYSIVN